MLAIAKGIRVWFRAKLLINSNRVSVCKQRIPRITQKKFSEDDSYFR